MNDLWETEFYMTDWPAAPNCTYSGFAPDYSASSAVSPGELMRQITKTKAALNELDPVYVMAKKKGLDLDDGYVMMMSPADTHELGIENHPKVRVSMAVTRGQAVFVNASTLGLAPRFAKEGGSW
jgi:hypothetical protein